MEECLHIHLTLNDPWDPYDITILLIIIYDDTSDSNYNDLTPQLMREMQVSAIHEKIEANLPPEKEESVCNFFS